MKNLHQELSSKQASKFIRQKQYYDNFVAVNLSVSLLLAPRTNNNLSRRQCTDILEATFEYIQQAGRRLWSASQLIARSCISVVIKQQINKK